MMDDLVSRKWLLEEYDRRHKGPRGGAYQMILDAPSAGRATGKWIPSLEYKGYMVCSECDNAYVESDWVTAGNVKWHYCPNCGCRMEVEHE